MPVENRKLTLEEAARSILKSLLESAQCDNKHRIKEIELPHPNESVKELPRNSGVIRSELTLNSP